METAESRPALAPGRRRKLSRPEKGSYSNVFSSLARLALQRHSGAEGAATTTLFQPSGNNPFSPTRSRLGALGRVTQLS